MPTYPSLTLSFEDRLTQHFQEFGEARLNSQAWPKNVTLEILSQNAKPYQGGEYISEVLEDSYEPTGSSIGEGATLTPQQVNISLPAMYKPKWVYEAVYMDGIRRDKIMTQGSMGPILNWAQELVNAAGRRLRERVSRYLTAATTADTTNDPTSLFDIIKASGSLGGVDPTQFTWWASPVTTTSAAWTASGPALLRTQLRNARKYQGFSGPDVFLASGTTVDAMRAGGYAKTTFFRAPDEANKPMEVGDGKTRWSAHAPFDPDAMFDNIPVYYDPHLDALESSSLSTGGVLAGICTPAIFLRQKSGMVFSVEPWRPSENKYGSYTRVMWCGEAVARNRSASTLRTNIL
jgi:hypothetical protein